MPSSESETYSVLEGDGGRDGPAASPSSNVGEGVLLGDMVGRAMVVGREGMMEGVGMAAGVETAEERLIKLSKNVSEVWSILGDMTIAGAM